LAPARRIRAPAIVRRHGSRAAAAQSAASCCVCPKKQFDPAQSLAAYGPGTRLGGRWNHPDGRCSPGQGGGLATSARSVARLTGQLGHVAGALHLPRCIQLTLREIHESFTPRAIQGRIWERQSCSSKNVTCQSGCKQPSVVEFGAISRIAASRNNTQGHPSELYFVASVTGWCGKQPHKPSIAVARREKPGHAKTWQATIRPRIATLQLV